MKTKRLLVIVMLLCSIVTARAQEITGRVVDEERQPVAYANVVALNAADSVYVEGAVTQEDGTFALTLPRKADYLLRVSSVGYETTYASSPIKGTVIVLPVAANLLGEVVVKGNVPQHRMTADGMATQVEGTVLSQLGTGEDVLSQVPGITKTGNGFEVFGKGAPLVYINGRVMRDASELDQLKSQDIKSVEVIRNPGARYDAQVKCVVRIRTKRAQGEGFGFDVRSSYYQSENTDLYEQLNWNYRRGRLDLFGMFYYSLNNSNSPSTSTTTVGADTLWVQHFDQEVKEKWQTFQNTVGINYVLNDKHSLGARYNLTLKPDSHNPYRLVSDITANGARYDHLDNMVQANYEYEPTHQLNLYYNGTVGKSHIDFNADYQQNEQTEGNVCDEHSSDRESRTVHSESRTFNRLFAAKLAVETPLFGGNLTWGAEYTHTHRNDDYINPEQYVPTSYAKLKEWHLAPFVEYSRELPIGTVSAGLRYEQVVFDYYENDVHIDSQSRSFGNLFPSLTFGTQVGKWQLQLSYAARTQRPSYGQLNNNVSYGNRFLWQSGNPLLKHEYIHDLSLAALWKFIQMGVNYTDRRDAIINWEEGNGSVA